MLPEIAFFGTPEYSVILLDRLYQAGYSIACVVTKPPLALGRKKILTSTPVAKWAKKHHIALLTPKSNPDKPWLFADHKQVYRQVLKHSPDLLITADYTQKIPIELINKTKFGGLNIHPSLLPAYQGPAPIPWAIYNGEKETGVSIVTLTEKLDQGKVIAQQKVFIKPTDTTPTLLQSLFSKGAELLVKIMPNYVSDSQKFQIPKSKFQKQPSYFPRLTRDHGYEPWKIIQKAIQTGQNAEKISRKFRAFHPWPGLWTKIKLDKQEKRMKILKIHLSPNLVIDQIQLEGKKLYDETATQNFLKTLLPN